MNGRREAVSFNLGRDMKNVVLIVKLNLPPSNRISRVSGLIGYIVWGVLSVGLK